LGLGERDRLAAGFLPRELSSGTLNYARGMAAFPAQWRHSPAHRDCDWPSVFARWAFLVHLDAIGECPPTAPPLAPRWYAPRLTRWRWKLAPSVASCWSL